MTSLKHFSFFLMIVIVHARPKSNEGKPKEMLQQDGLASCFCGVFKEADDPEKKAPIFEKKTSENQKFTHDKNGEKACQRVCESLAESARSRAPWLICNTLKNEHVENLKVKVYSRLCSGTWSYTGKKSKSPVCCHLGQPFQCSGAIDGQQLSK